MVVAPRSGLATRTVERTAPSPKAVRVAATTSLGALLLAGCGGGGGGSVAPTGPQTAHAELARVEYGRLADVYAYSINASGQRTVQLYQRDVLIGPNVADQRGTNSTLRDDQIEWDFLSSDAETLQPRLLIPRDVTSESFRLIFDALDDEARLVVPMSFGQGGPGQPYSVVPRNCGIRLTFTSGLGIDDDFFVVRNAQGTVTGLRNTEAVQLLQIAGDPSLANNLRPLPVRIVVRDNVMVLDPVLLGSEGLQYLARNNAAGLPESPDQVGANIRIALALEGPLAFPRVRSNAANDLIGTNNSGARSLIRDFRSGNLADTSSDISRGFVRDPEPPRIVGTIPMFLERVDPVNEFTQEVTIYKNGIEHEIDSGDVLRFVIDNSGVPVATSEVVSDPEDDRDRPTFQHVRARIRIVPNLEDYDPSNNPNFPPEGPQRDEWLARNAPRALLVAEFAAGGRPNPNNPTETLGDQPRYFITFSPEPRPDASGVVGLPNEFVSPFAGAIVRFTKPVDVKSVRWADTFFFATRNLLDEAVKEDFIANRPHNVGGGGFGMDPASFREAKYRTPHLIASRLFDEDGSQTSLRLQPTSGFYLDDVMRNPPPNADYSYFLHLVAGPEDGIRDLAGNPLDLQADDQTRRDFVTIPFTVDTRSNGVRPNFDNNYAVSLVRRLADEDEDEGPSYYRREDIQSGATPVAAAYNLADVFGPHSLINGQLVARPTSRTRTVVDNLNQAPVAAQSSPLRWCPFQVGGEDQIASNTSTTPFGQGIQNPLNPYGSRLQTVWREIDLSLSRVDPRDFNLDVEQMYWAPFDGNPITFDEFDRVSLFLGHSEKRPEPCVGNFSALPSLPDSGLQIGTDGFYNNYIHNLQANTTGTVRESQPDPHPAYVDAVLQINPTEAVYEPNNSNRFLPLPDFRKPYFVYRDETVVEQGCASGVSSDVANGNGQYDPYIITPWNHGSGRHAVQEGSTIVFVNGFWNTANNYSLANLTARPPDRFTDGLVGHIALPLLADFWTYCDSSSLPAGGGYVAIGNNGWQISITLQSSPQPNFRVYSGGRPPVGAGAALCIGPASTVWRNPGGGYPPGSTAATPAGDNSLYWIMIDFLKRATVVTSGFVDLMNPHRMATNPADPNYGVDPRLGPYFFSGGAYNLPQDTLPYFTFNAEGTESGGTAVTVQFRGAGSIEAQPWYYANVINTGALYPAAWRPQMLPTIDNFPLDPYKACDAHIRKFDDRPSSLSGGAARNWWTYLYNRTLTSYVQDPNTLMDASFTRRFAGPNEGFTPRDIRFVNWRFLMSNNTEATPPVAPQIDTFALAYRFQRRTP
jgi:hypothetical protein